MFVHNSPFLAPRAFGGCAHVARHAGEGGGLSGLVDIGGGRKMYLECSGTGSPTVVLISGKGNGAADWSEVLDPADPARHADYDAVAWGKGDLHKSDAAVFPMVSRFTRVCAYDRPGVRLDGPDQSTPVDQPHPAEQAADDLHRLLIAGGETGPLRARPPFLRGRGRHALCADLAERSGRPRYGRYRDAAYA